MRSQDPTTVVIVDEFEQASCVPAALTRFDLRVKVEPLPACDYQIGRGILIERKSVHALATTHLAETTGDQDRPAHRVSTHPTPTCLTGC